MANAHTELHAHGTLRVSALSPCKRKAVNSMPPPITLTASKTRLEYFFFVPGPHAFSSLPECVQRSKTVLTLSHPCADVNLPWSAMHE